MKKRKGLEQTLSMLMHYNSNELLPSEIYWKIRGSHDKRGCNLAYFKKALVKKLDNGKHGGFK